MMIKFCISLNNIEELRTVERATKSNFVNIENGSFVFGDIDFPIVYFYYDSVESDKGEYDIYEYGGTDVKYRSEMDFKRGILQRCLEENPELIELTLEELVTDYAEYLI